MGTAHTEILIPLLPRAKAVGKQVRQALVQRKPAGYNRVFLDDYRPNETCYCSQAIPDELLLNGQAVGSQEPAGT